MSETCRACGAELVWALTKNGPSPVTRQPKGNGNVLLFRGLDGEVRAAVVDAHVRAWAVEQGVPLRLNHFADCPDAERFR